MPDLTLQMANSLLMGGGLLLLGAALGIRIAGIVLLNVARTMFPPT